MTVVLEMEAEILEETETHIRVRIINGFGNPEMQVCKKKVVVHRPASEAE